jgi:hypothetical protein
MALGHWLMQPGLPDGGMQLCSCKIRSCLPWGSTTGLGSGLKDDSALSANPSRGCCRPPSIRNMVVSDRSPAPTSATDQRSYGVDQQLLYQLRMQDKALVD